MTRTVYTIHEDQHSYETTEARVAAQWSHAGLRVTARVVDDG